MVDPMHGSGGRWVESFLKGGRLNVETIRGERDTLFGGVAPEPIDRNLAPLKERVRERRALVGLATDGDADRVGAVNELGETMTMHEVVPLVLLHLARVRGQSGGIVRTFSQSVLLKRIAAAHNLPLHETPIGFKYIADLMLREDILIGAEESGGIGVRGHIPERDGILNSLLFLEAIAAAGKTPTEMVREMHREFGEFYFGRRDLHIEVARGLALVESLGDAAAGRGRPATPSIRSRRSTARSSSSATSPGSSSGSPAPSPSCASTRRQPPSRRCNALLDEGCRTGRKFSTLNSCPSYPKSNSSRARSTASSPASASRRRSSSARGSRPRTRRASSRASCAARRFEKVGRRGKHILAELDNGRVLITHLRMTGRFLLLPARKRAARNTRTPLFHLDDGRRLAFTDQRHFGLMKVVPAELLADARELRGLAPEPFSEEFTPDYLAAVFARTQQNAQGRAPRPDEGHGARQHLRRRSAPPRARQPLLDRFTLTTPRRSRASTTSILDVLGEALAHGSTMNVDPENIDGSYFGGGGYNGRWRVYDREGEPCRKCRDPIRRITHAGRSTYFCPRCQLG